MFGERHGVFFALPNYDLKTMVREPVIPKVSNQTEGKPLNRDEIRFAVSWIYLAVVRFGGGSDSTYASIEYDYCGAG